MGKQSCQHPARVQAKRLQIHRTPACLADPPSRWSRQTGLRRAICFAISAQIGSGVRFRLRGRVPQRVGADAELILLAWQLWTRPVLTNDDIEVKNTGSLQETPLYKGNWCIKLPAFHIMSSTGNQQMAEERQDALTLVWVTTPSNTPSKRSEISMPGCPIR